MKPLLETSAAEIRQQLTQKPVFGHHCDLSGRLVREAVDLSNLTLCGFDFSGSRFESALIFDNSVCKGLSWFRGSTFDHGVRFSGTRFFNDARFDNCLFKDCATFAGAEFCGIATFDGCTANGGLSFERILANGNFSIHSARLDTKPQFGGAKIMGGLWTGEASQLSAFVDPSCEIHGRMHQ